MKLSHKVSYVVINDKNQASSERQILKIPAEAFCFPLNQEDMASIKALEKAFDDEGKIAGLAAPQIGIKKRAIIFQAPIELKKWREDFTHAVPKTIWLNPSYEPLGDEKRIDYEGCFSVNDLAGKVPRFQRIKYQAYLVDGKKIEGVAEGYLARVLQHEIDHLNGILFIDKIPQDQLISIDEYQRLRDAKMGE